MGSETFDNLKTRIEGGQAHVGILGLGYVGLPLAVEFGAAGLRVTGFDLSESKINSLNAGESYIRDVETARLRTDLGFSPSISVEEGLAFDLRAFLRDR